MDRYEIEISEVGYTVQDKQNQTPVIEGIREWETACEVHEMIVGEDEE
ncbi:MAG: hypothetical protein HQL54_06820 [Magnetococcales bacterium]|nr:hypothetical protein [Magnetococcales bacterium]